MLGYIILATVESVAGRYTALFIVAAGEPRVCLWLLHPWWANADPVFRFVYHPWPQRHLDWQQHCTSLQEGHCRWFKPIDREFRRCCVSRPRTLSSPHALAKGELEVSMLSTSPACTITDVVALAPSIAPRSPLGISDPCTSP